MDDRLTRTLTEIGESAPHDPLLAERVRHQASRRSPVRPLLAAAAVLAVVGTGVLLSRPEPTVPPTGSPSPGCRAVTTGVLPTWARSGFTPPYDATYTTSASGDLVAVLFVDLREPQVSGTANKVLWVPRIPVGSPVALSGRRLDSDQTTRVTLPSGLGPSIVDVPAPGCWRFAVTWAGGSDQIDLSYAG